MFHPLETDIDRAELATGLAGELLNVTVLEKPV